MTKFPDLKMSGSLSFQKQVGRKYYNKDSKFDYDTIDVFENLEDTFNEEENFSLQKKVPNVRISRYASRRELFKLPEFMNQYDPNYNQVSQKMVNVIIKNEKPKIKKPILKSLLNIDKVQTKYANSLNYAGLTVLSSIIPKQI